MNVQPIQESPSVHYLTIGSATVKRTKDGPNGLRGLLGHTGNFKAGSSHPSAILAVGIRAALRVQCFVLSWSQTKEATEFKAPY